MSVAATPEPGATWNASAEEAPKRILFVDDTPDTFGDLKDALGPAGAAWQVEYAGGGDAALAALEREPVDVVIAEDQLGSMDGVTLLTRVRDQHPTTIRMIVSATTKPGLATIVSHRFLSKPCNVDELAVLIKRSCALQDRSGEVEAFRKTMATTALPSRPGVYMELNGVLADPDWQPHQVSAVLERDVAMSAKVLQLAALLHDIGKLVLISDASRRWAQLTEQARQRQVPMHVVEQETDGVTHAHVDAHLLSL